MVIQKVIGLIIGKWKTPNHSNRRSEDDTHEIKKQILKAIGNRNFTHEVGNNPDIDINKEGIIILKGRSDFKNKPYYVSDIRAEDFFILRFSPTIQDETIIECIMMKNNIRINLIPNLENLYIIPNEDDVLDLTIEFILNQYNNQILKVERDYLILLK